MKENIKQILLLVMMGIFIVLLLITIIILIKNKDLITKDPILYKMEKSNYTACSCWDDKGNLLTFKKEGDLNGPNRSLYAARG